MTVAIFYERVMPDGTVTETHDVDYCCGYLCASDVAREKSLPGYVEECTSRGMDGTWRSLDDDSGLSWQKVYGVETDYNVYCASDTCRDLLWEGLSIALDLSPDDDPNLIFA